MSSETESAQNAASAPSPNSDSMYPTLCWRYSWYNLALIVVASIILSIIAVALGVFITHIAQFDDTYKPYLWSVLGLLPVIFFLGNLCSFLYFRLMQSYELRFNDLRFSKGFFNRRSSVMLLHPIWGMKLHQSLFQRCFGLGTIVINSADTSTKRFKITGLGDMPSRFYTLEKYRLHSMEKLRTRPKDAEHAPEEPIQWRYSGFDLMDETIWGIIFTLVFLAIAIFVPLPVPAWITYSVASILPLIYWSYLAFVYVDKIRFTSYTLTESTLEMRSGIFYKKYEIFSLFHLTDCEPSQNLWQRMMGVGNIILYLKWEEQDNSSAGTSSGKEASPKVRTIVLHGLKDYMEKFDMLQDYRSKEQQSHVAGSL